MFDYLHMTRKGYKKFCKHISEIIIKFLKYWVLVKMFAHDVRKNEHMKYTVHIGRLLCKVYLVLLHNRVLCSEILHNEILCYEILRHKILRYQILRYILLVQEMNFIHTVKENNPVGNKLFFTQIISFSSLIKYDF